MTGRMIISVACILLIFCRATAQQGTAAIDARLPPFRETVYVGTDKNEYLAGEILWWKAYYLNGFSQEPDSLSRILYVEILNDSLHRVLQAKVQMDQRGANGSFFLRGNLPSGEYLLRAYTRWTKFSDPENIFARNIRIVNATNPRVSGGDTSRPILAVHFSPEGGHLVRGLNNRVGVELVDQYLRPQPFSATVISSASDTAAVVTVDGRERGSFLFLPDTGKTYHAIITPKKGAVINVVLPTEEKGYVLKTAWTSTHTLNISVSTNVINGSPLFLKAVWRGVPGKPVPLKVENGNATTEIDTSALGTGVNQIVLADEHGLELAQRRVYRKAAPKMLNLGVSTDAAAYNTRKPVRLMIDAVKDSTANLSVAVYRLDSTNIDSSFTLHNYLRLGADLAGNKTFPMQQTGDDDTAIDELLLAQLPVTHSRKNTSTADALDSLAEIDGHIISGRITRQDGRPLPGMRLTLGIPAARGDCYLTVADSLGRFWFDIRNYYGPGKIYIQAIDPKTIDYQIHVDDPFDTSLIAHSAPTPWRVPDTLNRALEKLAVGVQVQNIFWSPELGKTYTPGQDTLAFYGNHYVQYKLDDYVRFTTMEEVLREYVLEVNVRRRGNAYEFLVLDPLNKMFLPQAPLILLDGVLVSTDQVIRYDPLKVRSLKVVTYNYHLGPFFYGGVIHFRTYRESAEDLTLDPKALIMDYDGLQQKMEFFSPQYSTPDLAANRKPDFRNVLYWNPNIALDSSGHGQCQFFTGDLKGKYLVVVEGIDKFGNSGSSYHTFEVK